MPEKTGRNVDDERQSNFGLKLNVHRYNMLTAITHRLTCLQTEVNNKVFRGQLFAHFCLGAGVRMLKISTLIFSEKYKIS